MKYLCRRGHWHLSVDDRTRCNDGFSIEDESNPMVANIPTDMTPEVDEP